MASIAFTSKKTLQTGRGLHRPAQMTLLHEGIGRTLTVRYGSKEASRERLLSTRSSPSCGAAIGQ